MKILTYDELIRQIEKCKTFRISTESERKQALMIGRAMGKKVATRKNGDGGFKVYVLE